MTPARQHQTQTARFVLDGTPPQLPAGAFDRGPLAPETPVRRIQIILGKTATQQADLDALLTAQQTPGSADFQRWLTPAAFGLRFGPSADSLEAVTAWLRASGFSDVHISHGQTMIEVSGTEAAVEAAFQTQLHAVSLATDSATVSRYINVAQPTVPVAFAGLIRGVASLNNLQASPDATPARRFRRDQATGKVTAADTGTQPDFTLNSNNQIYYAITPYDFAALYDVLPLWNAATAVDGTGQTIAIIGETDINPADFVSFRKLFGLPLGSTASQTGSSYLNIIYNGLKPAVSGEEFHADSDIEWAGAAARGATIDYVASQTTEASSGLALSAQYVVDNNLASILVDSYSTCELALGTSGNLLYNTLWQQAAAQGITVVTASGDSGAAGCDAPHYAPAIQGAAVNGIASTPYDVAVGGTELYTPNGASQYFSAANSATNQSVKGYIPEAVWNDSCTNPVILAQPPYTGQTAEQACNSVPSTSPLRQLSGSGGGASSCLTSDGKTAASCKGGYAKPSWQVGAGVPADGLRDVPDVALFASQGRTNNFYIVCQQSRDTDGNGCNLDFPYADFSAYGGTEIAAPAFAGILALAGQRTGQRLGNANPVLYKLAAQQTQTGTACNATSGSNSGCYFHDITLGTNAVPCSSGTPGCITATAGDAVGVLSGSSVGAGYDLATGLGSVDAANLVNAWSRLTGAATSAVLTISPASSVHGSAVTANVTVSGSAGAPTGAIALEAQAANGFAASGTLANGAVSLSLSDLPGGSYGVRAHYAGDAVNAPTDSNFVSVTVSPEPSTLKLSTLAFDPVSDTGTPQASAPYGTVFFIRADIAGQSGQGLATGNVDILDNGTIFGSGVVRVNSSGYAEAQSNNILPGKHVFNASYVGDASFNPSSSAPVNLTIYQAPTTAAVTSSVSTVASSATVTFTVTIDTAGYGYAAPTGQIVLFSGSAIVGQAVLSATTDATYHTAATATVTLPAAGLPLGLNSISVSYAGDADYTSSASPYIPLNVINQPLTPTVSMVTATPGSVPTYGTIVFAAQVSTASAQPPTGQVQFLIDGRNVGAAQTLVNGAASLPYLVTPLLPGQHTVQAVYLSNATYASSASAPAIFVISSPTLTGQPVFTATPTALVQGTFVTVAAQVALSAALTPTGTLQLVLDGSPYGSAFPVTNAGATLPLVTTTIQAGTHILTVFYSGDHYFTAAYAPPVNLSISAPGVTPSSVVLSGLASQIAQGTGSTLIATVTPTSPVPTGVFQIAIDGGNPGLPVLLNGSVNTLSLPSAGLALGSHTVTVYYSGDNTYDFATSAAGNFTVVPPIVIPGDFSLSPVTLSLTGSRAGGASPAAVLTLTPTNFNGLVTFSCSGLPAFTACSFSPASLTLAGSATQSTTVTILLNTGYQQRMALAAGNGLKGIMLITSAGLIGVFFVRGRRRRRLPALFILAMVAALAGCGGSFANGSSQPGNFNVIVSATGGGITRTSTINLTIN